MSLPVGNGVGVRRLLWTGPASEALTARRRVEAMLSQTSGRPAGLPSSAILSVRRLQMTLLSRRPARGLGRLWDDSGAALEETIARCGRSAARPALGGVPPGAGAVVFFDHAELLACLAVDWVRGEAPNRWWWQAMFSRRSATQAVSEAWLASPTHVPTALSRLTHSGQAAAFLRALPESCLTALEREVSKAFMVEELAAAVRENLEDAIRNPSPNPSGPPNATSNASTTSNKSATSADRPLLSKLRATVTPGLSSAARTLAALCEILTEHPVEARSVKYVRELRREAQELNAMSPAAANGNASRPVPASDTQHDERDRSSIATAKPFSGRRSPPIPRQLSFPATISSPQEPPSADGSGARSQAGDSGSETAVHASLTRGAPPATPLPRSAANHETIAANSATGATEKPLPTPEEQIYLTAWGGIFYLANVALALGFYGDFTQAGPRPLAMSLWDFLALMGQALIGPDFEKDVCWGVFARLSGRTNNEPPAGHFEDLPNWIEQTARTIEESLSKALGENGPALRDLVFPHKARVLTDAEQVAVTFSLASHPVGLRLAGLDRDPGWVPAGGRRIVFSYQ